MKRLGHQPALDGLRGVAILLVVGRHAFRTPLGGGYGVDLFFVLSGFLITTLLLEERDVKGTVSIRSFYARRARRLLPALIVLLATYVTVESAAGHSDALRSTAAAGFYTANIFQSWWPHVIGRTGLSPLWSLAQEEQFYLVAPVVLFFALRKVSERTVKRVVLVLIVAVIIERYALMFTGAAAQRITEGPDTHSDGLMLGMVLALSLREQAQLGSARYDKWLGPLALLLLVPFAVLNLVFAVSAPFVNVAAMGLVCAVVVQPRSLLARLLAARPLTFMGRISYSLYLWNAALIFWLGGDAGGNRHAYSYASATAAVVLALAISWLSYRFVEQPFRRIHGRTPIWAPAHRARSSPAPEPSRG
jgi:peptidoglycan/LPS O-acetylase OafA/YrhL